MYILTKMQKQKYPYESMWTENYYGNCKINVLPVLANRAQSNN